MPISFSPLAQWTTTRKPWWERQYQTRKGGGAPVVTLDRRKLTAPVLAQAAAFVVVLVIGGVTGHGGGKPVPGRSPSSTSPAGHVRSTAPATAAPARSTELTVEVSQAGDGVTARSVSLKILKAPALTLVLRTSLTARLAGTPMELTATVPEGVYQVCVTPPPGWMVTGHNKTGALAGGECSKVDATPGTPPVTFQLTPASPDTGILP
jgi:hypothetical protein